MLYTEACCNPTDDRMIRGSRGKMASGGDRASWRVVETHMKHGLMDPAREEYR